MFGFIKKYRERKLRERCIKYALTMNNLYTPKILIEVADKIKDYIKNS